MENTSPRSFPLKRRVLGIRILLQDLRLPEIWGLGGEPQAPNRIKAPVFWSLPGRAFSVTPLAHLSLRAPSVPASMAVRSSHTQAAAWCVVSPTTFIPCYLLKLQSDTLFSCSKFNGFPLHLAQNLTSSHVCRGRLRDWALLAL